MDDNIRLVLHNILILISFSSMVVLTYFLLTLRNRRRVHTLLALTAICVIVYQLTHMISVNLVDAQLSRIFMFANVSTIFICIFNFHCVLEAINRARNHKQAIITAYVVGLTLATIYLIFPHLFLDIPTPKMYFNNYYNPGPLLWIEILIFHNLLPAYFIYILFRSFRSTSSIIERNRLRYFSLSLFLGYTFGQLSSFLFYNIPIDPIYGIFFPILFCIPFTYAVLNHDLLDIRIVAKRAFYFGVLVAICAIILVLLNFLNRWVEEIIPGIPVWIVPLLSSVFAVAIGVAVWQKVKDSDILRFNLVNKTMHDIRTPITHIKLATESLAESPLNDEQRATLSYIEKANEKMVKVTEEWVKGE